MDPFFIKVMLAATLGGASISLMGTIIIGMRIPFLGIYVSHGAMVGAVFGALMGFQQMPSALVASLTSALVLGSMTKSDRGQTENVAVGILFSVSMALVFLGMGLSTESKTQMLQLMWGSILLVRTSGLYAICISFAVLLVFFLLFFKEIRAIVFSRLLAASSGIRETCVWVVFLIVASLIITSSLPVVGGLMIFSLVTNPPAAAFRIARNFRNAVILASVFGAASGLGGFLVSYYGSIRLGLNLPTGACIALFSALVYTTAVLAAKIRGA